MQWLAHGPEQEVGHARPARAQGPGDLLQPADRLTSDVLVGNYRPGTIECGALARTVHERNPGLIVVRVSGYGQTGPYRHRPGFGSVAESMGGIRYVTGYEDRPPTRMNISIGDTLAGMYGVIGALMGLLARERGLGPAAARRWTSR